MGDNWDDSGDEWDAASEGDEDLDAKLGLSKKANVSSPPAAAANVFDEEEEEDLAMVEKVKREHTAALRTKGRALAAKKRAEEERKEEEELTRRVVEQEAEMEANMSAEERRLLDKQRVEDADHALTNQLFGPTESTRDAKQTVAAANTGDVLIMKTLKDHLKHARKIGQCIKEHGKTHLATAFLKEVIMECKDVLEEDAITDLIKTCNVIKNEKVAEQKRKVKGQAQKPKKRDKAAEALAQKLQVELYGDNDKYDNYDEMGAQFEDDFF